MIADDGKTPILMDFGSTMLARVHIENRSQALLQQDIAAEQSTMAYRAPELFDVKTGQTIDEKVDIWVGLSYFSLVYIFLLKLFLRWYSRWVAPSLPLLTLTRLLRILKQPSREGQ